MTSDLHSRSAALKALTEGWGLPMPMKQISMAKTRYQFASGYGQDARVLEIACGAGFGSRFLSGRVAQLVAGDLAEGNLADTRAHLRNVPLVRFDAHNLPFRDRSFDVVVAFECVYYFSSAEVVATECQRVLDAQGHLLLACANPERVGFHESPHSVHYFNAEELRTILSDSGFDAEIFGAFPEEIQGLRGRILVRVTSLAKRFHLVPNNLRVRAIVKRFFSGRLQRFEGIEDPSIPVEELRPILPGEAASSYAVLYAAAHRTGS